MQKNAYRKKQIRKKERKAQKNLPLHNNTMLGCIVVEPRQRDNTKHKIHSKINYLQRQV